MSVFKFLFLYTLTFLLILCNGQTPIVYSIPFADLKAHLGIPADAQINVQVRAHNQNGWSHTSDTNVAGATMEYLPGLVGTLTLDITQTTNTQIAFSWDALLDGIQTGGTGVIITKYEIYWYVAGVSTYFDFTTSNSYIKYGLTSGTTYQFLVRAVNKFGEGDFVSTPTSFKTGQPPEIPSYPVLSMSGIYVKIAFTSPAINNFAIDKYKILINGVGGNQIESLTYCDGSSFLVISQMYCIVPMEILRESPFSLTYGLQVTATIQAHNIRGWSGTSSPNPSGPTIQTQPLQMDPPTLGSLTNKNSVQISWLPVSSASATGGSSIISYIVYWDSGTSGSTWTELAGKTSLYLGLSYTISTGIVTGYSYQFKIQAENIWGIGPFSTVLTTIAASVPSQIIAPTTSIDSTTGNVIISWNAPSSNGQAITSYLIQIVDHLGGLQTDLINCNGINNNLIVTNKQCSIPMSVFTSSPFTLLQGTLIQVAIQAINIIGTSTISSYNTVGALVATVPLAPSTLAKGALSSSNQIQLQWSALIGTDTGGSPITSYRIYWDNGVNDNTQTLIFLDSLIYTYTVTGLTTGTTYQFKLQGKNIYGYGALQTTALIIIAQDVPSTMSSPTITLDYPKIDISWSSIIPNSNGASIDYYEVQIFNPVTFTFSNDLTNCPSSSNLDCEIPISTLISSYGYNYGDILKARIRAHNAIGYGGYSILNILGSSLEGPPSYMNQPLKDPTTSTSTTLSLYWNAISSASYIGASVILSYQLEMYNTVTLGWDILQGSTPYDTTTSFIQSGLTAGTQYQFRLGAINIHGLGQYSTISLLTPSSIPTKMNMLTITQQGTNVKIVWTAPASNGASLTKYQIQILQKDSYYSEQITYCDGSNSVIIGQLYCLVPMSVFTASPYLFLKGDTTVAKARAYNSNGWGDYSDPNSGILVMTIPEQMIAPTKGSLTSETEIEVQWSPLTALTSVTNGGSTITSYHLQWDSGTLGVTWTDVIGLSPSSLSTDVIMTTSIISGQSYQFKVRAKNIFGWGAFSSITTIKASTVPYQISTPVTSIDPITGGVQITWNLPASGSNVIDAYLIQISNFDGSAYPDSTLQCIESSSTIIINRQCTIPMSVLRAAPYSLPFQQLVVVKITAHNSLGYGSPSSINTSGAKIRQIPAQMSSPTVISYSDSQIILTWSALSSPQNGDSSITSYELQWDNGGAVTPTIQLSNQLTTTYTINGGLTAGSDYQFMVRAYNIYGNGLFSSPLSITANDRPSKMAIPVVATSGTNVLIGFLEPDNHGSSITSYKFMIKKSDNILYDASSLCVELQSLIITQYFCTMAMTDIHTFTSLSVNQLIVVSVIATNSKGSSTASEVNIAGSTIEDKPLAMTTLTYDASFSTNTQIILTWTAPISGINTGGLSVAILDYTIQQNTGSGMAFYATTALTTLTISSLTGGQTYIYQIAARNEYGLGPYQTTPLSIVTGQPPNEIIILPTTSISSIYVKIAWTAPVSNFVTIDAYRILIKRNDGNYYEDTTYCDGSTSTILTNLYCFIPMITLINSPYNLLQGDIVFAKVQAHNSKGWGDISSPNTLGAAIQTVPHQMTVVRKNSLTSNIQIVLDWDLLAAPLNGDSSIISYGIQWDSGTSGATFSELIGETSDLIAIQHAISSGLVTGTTYQFKIRAKNKWGWGSYSSITSILAGKVPDIVSSVTTSIDSITGGVKIQWTAPNTNGAIISSYSIQIQDYNGAWQNDLTDCDGSIGTVINHLYCIIPMSTLIASPFSLTLDTLVVVQVLAINSIGSGSYSSVNTIGAKIKTIPLSQNLVLSVVTKTETEITLTWNALSSPNTGNSDITSYEIYWDNGSGTSSFVQLISQLVTIYTQTGLTQGISYIFRIRAYNMYGPGLFSSSDLAVTASNVPQIMDTVITSTVSLTSIKVTWIAPDNKGQAIDIYKIKIYNQATGLFVVDTSICDASVAPALTNMYCTFTIAYLQTTYAYVTGDLVKFIASAHNINGWSEFSSVNTIGSIIQTIPANMNSPYEGPATSATQIEIDWNALSTTTEIGASSITSYELTWDSGAGLGNFVIPTGFTTPYTSTSYLISSGLTTGTSYQFQLRAQNAIGYGGYSSIVTIIPSAVPSIVSTVVTSITGTNVLLQWSTPSTNGAAITKYKIKILQFDGIYSEPTSTYCDGSSPSIISNTQCYIPMSYLRSSPYSLTYSMLVKVQVQAYNSRGWGSLSLVNTLITGATIQTVPLQMTAPKRGSLTTQSVIQVTWDTFDALPNNGGSPIISYNLQWDYGTNGVHWYGLIGYSPSSLDLSYNLIHSIISGTSYLFRLRARNNYGWSDYSPTTQIIAATIPNSVINLVTSIDSSSGGVKISWSAPSNGGSVITAYKIEILKKGTTNWNIETTYCDGTSTTLLSNLYCIVPMTVLTSSPYSYIFQDIVYVRVSAYNQFGYSLVPTANTVGAQIRRIPAKMNTPTVVTKTDSQIIIQWVILTSSSNIGDSPILSYDLLWDQGNGGAISSQLIDDMITEYTISGLIGMQTYQFEVRARNIYGYGPLSDPLSVTASDIPEQINIDSLTASGTDFVVEFTPSDDHSSTIDQYEITFQYGSSTYTVLYTP